MSDEISFSHLAENGTLDFERDEDGDILVTIEYLSDDGESESCATIWLAKSNAERLAVWLKAHPSPPLAYCNAAKEPK